LKRITAVCLVIVGPVLAGCSNRPTAEELFAHETQCLRCYCASNAPAAEAALLDCVQYAQQCQRAGVKGIQYDEVFGRLYGRLYLVERHLGHREAAEQYLERYAHFHAASSSLARQIGRPHGEMERLITQKFDEGLQAGWKNH
jgi:hypothetical protein